MTSLLLQRDYAAVHFSIPLHNASEKGPALRGPSNVISSAERSDPVGRDAIAVVDRATIVSAPVLAVVLVAGCGLHLFLGEIDAIAVEAFVIGQPFPGKRAIVVADAPEADESQDRIGDLAALLFENDTLDRADALAVAAIDDCTFYLVAGNQASGGDAIVDVYVKVI